MDQPSLFNVPTNAAVFVAPEQLVLFAFGEFQARGKVLAGRELLGGKGFSRVPSAVTFGV